MVHLHSIEKRILRCKAFLEKHAKDFSECPLSLEGICDEVLQMPQWKVRLPLDTLIPDSGRGVRLDSTPHDSKTIEHGCAIVSEDSLHFQVDEGDVLFQHSAARSLCLKGVSLPLVSLRPASRCCQRDPVGHTEVLSTPMTVTTTVGPPALSTFMSTEDFSWNRNVKVFVPQQTLEELRTPRAVEARLQLKQLGQEMVADIAEGSNFAPPTLGAEKLFERIDRLNDLLPDFADAYLGCVNEWRRRKRSDNRWERWNDHMKDLRRVILQVQQVSEQVHIRLTDLGESLSEEETSGDPRKRLQREHMLSELNLLRSGSLNKYREVTKLLQGLLELTRNDPDWSFLSAYKGTPEDFLDRIAEVQDLMTSR